jgi:hypothetical protein
LKLNVADTSDSKIEDILLKNRNITPEKMESFFNPKYSDLFDPYSFKDMLKSVERILEAKEQKERVVIF